MKIRGKIVEGLGVGRDFTCIQWVKAQFISKLSIDPYPGTLNLEIVEPKDLQTFEALKATHGIEITPEDPSFCKGTCFQVLINGRVKGAIVLPVVESYPGDKMELITSENVKKALSVETGDVLEVEIL
jgi:riboflavin kinase, archaea type